MFKIIKLSANKESFHEIKFKDGVNIILGKQKIKAKSNKKSTTNGIGKSLVIKIIDFCLASDKVKEWEAPLAEWVFTLTINVDGVDHTLSRAINKQNLIVFDGEEKKIKEVREILRTYTNISSDFSFRQIINRYLRKGKLAYNNYLTTIKGEKDCNTLLVVTYLLGFDYLLCKEKIKLKQDLDGNGALLRKAKSDPSFQSLFGIGQCDIDLELSNIAFEIEKLEEEITAKNYAENYEDIQAKANEISNMLDTLSNRKFVVLNNIDAITKALSREITVGVENVKEIYREIGIYFSNNLIHTLEELESFHVSLLNSRKEALSKDLSLLQKELNQIDGTIVGLNDELNEKLEFLKIHSAMDKYVVAVRQIDALKAKKKEIEKIANIEKEIKTKIEQIKKDIADSNISAQTYLDGICDRCENINKQFVSLTKTFYENKKSALSIKCNDGDNQIRFNVDARITSDGSDGIQEIITFCFDWVLLLQNVTNIGFIYHDSLLIANVEQRQKEILFTKISELCASNYQYIININKDQIEGFAQSTIDRINNDVVLTITDESVASKLLGIEVDLGREIE